MEKEKMCNTMFSTAPPPLPLPSNRIHVKNLLAWHLVYIKHIRTGYEFFPQMLQLMTFNFFSL